MNPSNLRSYLAVVFLVTLCAVTAAAQLQIVPTTTLSAETANNTSASSTFKAQTNGNAAAGNVSKLPIRNLLYAGSTTKIYAAVMPWFGRSDHMSIGYNSADPAEIRAQVDDMLSRGIQGAIIPWYGRSVSINSEMALNYMAEANSRGGAFEFSIMIDVGDLVTYAQQNGCDVTQQLIDDLNYIAGTFYGSTAYTRVGSGPAVYFFDVDAYYIDWNKVRASVSGNPTFLKRNQGGFTATQSNGAYSWVEINTSNPNDMMLSYLDSFYTTAAQYPTQYEVGSTYKGFNDTLAAWGSNRIVNQQCARTWLDTFAEINKYYSSSRQLPALQLVTWNDYEEGTEMETGIDNCVALTTNVTGSTLNWNIGGAATESSIHHYAVFISTDGQNLMKLADVPTGTRSLNLAQYNLASATYVLYVQAVGQPSIVNHMSRATGFNPADQAPIASLSLSSTSGPAPLAITASGTASSDPDGSIIAGSIDFGDGTLPVSGLTASHTYGTPGKYTVTLTVTDNAGVFASAQATVTVAAGLGVTILQPGAGATVNSPVHVVATGNIVGGVGYMEVLVDGVTPPAYVTAGASIDTFIKIAAGTHQLRVVAHDTTPAANYIFSDITIFVATTDAPPTARLSVNPFGGGNQVMACTATSDDSDGFIVSSFVDFGDGATGGGPTVFHTYSSAGTYTVTATVTDNQGVSSTTTTPVTVGSPGGTCSAPSSPGVNICSPANGSSVTSPFTITAAGKNTNGTSGMDVWLDGVKLGFVANSTTVNMSANAAVGSHQLDIYAVGLDGELKLQTSIFTVTTSGGGGGGGDCPIPSSPSVTICLPASGSSNSSPVRILASGRDSGATAGMDVWIDGIKLGFFANSQTVDTQASLASGTHLLDIYAVGTNGELQKSSVTFSVGGTPVACAVPSSPGVNICSPANGSTVSSPVQIVAAGKDNSTTAGMDVWIDGVKFNFFPNTQTVNATANLPSGTHQLDIYAVGANNELQKSISIFNVQ